MDPIYGYYLLFIILQYTTLIYIQAKVPEFLEDEIWPIVWFPIIGPIIVLSVFAGLVIMLAPHFLPAFIGNFIIRIINKTAKTKIKYIKEEQ